MLAGEWAELNQEPHSSDRFSLVLCLCVALKWQGDAVFRTCQSDCTGPGRGQGCVNAIYATGAVENVSPPLPKQCGFGHSPPPAPAPTVQCGNFTVLGCFNDSSHSMIRATRWVSAPKDHDDVTRSNCASLCLDQHRPIAAIDQGNHCLCGDTLAVSLSAASFALPEPACEDKEWPCTGVCCGPHAHSDCGHGKCSGKRDEQCGGPGALLAYSYNCSRSDHI